jgi:hypothetical protein
MLGKGKHQYAIVAKGTCPVVKRQNHVLEILANPVAEADLVRI